MQIWWRCAKSNDQVAGTIIEMTLDGKKEKQSCHKNERR